MKKHLTRIITLSVALLWCIPLTAQWNLGNRIRNKTENRINNEIDKEIDKGLDKLFEGDKESKEKKESSKKKKKEKTEDNYADEQENSSNSNQNKDKLKAYGKFDFIPGEKIIVAEDFSQDALGDFPARWNTNGTGELVQVEGATGKWLKIGPKSIVFPDFISKLPENFTVEFMLACSQPFSYYSTELGLFFTPSTNNGEIFKSFPRFGSNRKNAVLLGLHPEAAGANGLGQKMINTYDESGAVVVQNNADFPDFNRRNKNIVKISIWRQKNRLRVYVDETKIWDIPKAFNSSAQYNTIGFSTYEYSNDNDAYYISDIKVAVGAPDTRHKFLDEGKYVTTGIKFDVNSAKIKGESYGTLKDFATLMKENPSIRVKIVGHTDSDGDESSNLTLSKKRAEAVKKALNEEFGIDNSRMETDGKGESQPVSPNTSSEGKANNRRVEFIKL